MAAIAILLIAALSGCGEDRASQAEAPAASVLPVVSAAPAASPPPAEVAAPGKDQAAVMLTIKNFAFAPKALQMRVGQTLMVTNVDSTVHTFTADDGSFDSGNLVQGQSFSYRPTKAGTYSYYCDPHQYMTGTITVS